jgi:hypothetical protein
MSQLVHPSFSLINFLFRSSMFLSFYALIFGVMIMQIWNFASRRRLMLQSPLDHWTLGNILITPFMFFVTCFTFITFHMHHLSPLCTAITQLTYSCYHGYACYNRHSIDSCSVSPSYIRTLTRYIRTL